MNFEQLVKDQRTFFRSHKTKSYEYRKDSLLNLKAAIKDHEAQLFEALKKDLGKSDFEAFGTEVGFILEEISHTVKSLKSWMKPKKVGSPVAIMPAKSQILNDPYGVALIISPWNYPFQLTFGPLVAAIAAGNTAIIKPSEFTPATSAVVEKIVAKVFKPEYVKVVQGGVPETTELLKQKYDVILFTGSTPVGKVVMRAAAEHLTPVILELGGKSPCIVDKYCDLEVAAKRVLWGKFLNCGQTCIAPDYLFIHEQIKDQFVEVMKKVIHGFFGEDIKSSPDYNRIVNKRHFDRLLGLSDGGEIIFGGDHDESQMYIGPTIIDNPKLDHPLMQEEIFGPLLPIMTYDHIQSVIDFINERPKPLALYLFTQNEDIQNQVLAETSSGGACINDTLVHISNSNLPFGGVGESGMGAYHGTFGFEAFSHQKAIVKNTLWPDIPIRYAPYKDKTKYLRLLFR